jgi:hypothetical protein
MHMHGIAANPNLGSLEAADAAQRSANAQRSADVRRQLAKSAAQMEVETSPDALVLLGHAHGGGQRLGADSSETEGGSKTHAATVSDESEEDGHWSYWA